MMTKKSYQWEKTSSRQIKTEPETPDSEIVIPWKRNNKTKMLTTRKIIRNRLLTFLTHTHPSTHSRMHIQTQTHTVYFLLWLKHILYLSFTDELFMLLVSCDSLKPFGTGSCTTPLSVDSWMSESSESKSTVIAMDLLEFSESS